MAQGSRLSQEQIDRVAVSLRHNPNWGAAADHAGVTDRVLRLYRERVESNTKDTSDLSEDERFYHEAVTAWTAARSEGERELIDAIRQAIDKDWKAADALLKKGWPDRYNERVELTGAGGGPIQVDADALWQRAEEVRSQIEAKRVADGQDPDANG